MVGEIAKAADARAAQLPLEQPEPAVSAAAAHVPTPELNKALAAVQSLLPKITKGERANVGTYGYDYAGLDAVSEKIIPLLGKHGLAFSCWPTLLNGRFVMEYHLLHSSGEQRTGIWPLVSVAKPQDLGGFLTYYRRYALMAVTGIAPGGEDDDAQSIKNQEQQLDQPRQRGQIARAARGQDSPGRGKLRELNGHLDNLGITDGPAKLEACRILADREQLTSAADLTPDEVLQIIEVLEGIDDSAALADLLAGR